MPNIRWRIGISVFMLVAVLQVVVALFVLARLGRVQRAEVDLLLSEELASAEALLGTPQLGHVIAGHELHNTKWNEVFFEIRDPSGDLAQRSANVPASGLGEATFTETVQRRNGTQFAVWERVHPASRKGHVRIRVAEARMGGRIIRVARSLKRYQRTQWRLRGQLAWGLLGTALFAAAGAWLVTRRSLRPVQEITREARLLGTSLQGELPRTGSRDELDKLAEVLNHMLGRIRTEVQRMRRLTADAAHGLRTPLTALRGQLELHLEGASEEESARVVALLETLDEMVVLVNRLLLLERLESGDLEQRARRERVAIDQLAREVVDGLSIVALDRKLDLRCITEPACVVGDPAALRNALLNVLDNALRHTPAGGFVRVTVHEEDGVVHIAVLDSGPGLRPDQMERVFERFYSDRDGPPGSGLGLAIARAVAEAHGGSLTATSPGGALFVFRLPPAP